MSGTQFNEGPSFDTGTAAAPLDSRPGYLTPFLTPLYDEDSHWQEYNAYRDLKREKQEDPGAFTPIKPLPAYAWHYRPEYQFSRLSLEIDEINRVSKDPQGQETKENLLDMATPVVASSDDLIEVLYSLIEAESPRLDPIDGGACQASCVCRSNAVRMEGICSDSMRSCRSDGGTDPPKSACRGRLQTTPERHWLKTVVVSVGGEGGSMWPVRYESRRRAQANHRQGAETE